MDGAIPAKARYYELLNGFGDGAGKEYLLRCEWMPLDGAIPAKARYYELLSEFGDGAGKEDLLRCEWIPLDGPFRLKLGTTNF